MEIFLIIYLLVVLTLPLVALITLGMIVINIADVIFQKK
jgi:hypothetical protein|tara:strand:- start:491 stop:607 length:117 start_codon:yes stop_codon:yes gene_type:complete